ncbi:MAG TPA: BON domain-containing protein [Rudaea sp.]|jgi:osmotically-inducible protein OsmY|nr:BON domain-containing protein [Rudaea sp.]
MKSWTFCAALTLAFGVFAGGCMEEPSKPCSGIGCVSDAEITANIKAEIDRHDELTDWTIDVQSINGVVYLHGMVDTDPQRRLVEDIARETRGVMGVENAIELRNFR